MPPSMVHETGLKKIYIMLVDISGYTRFIRFHKVSLLHAEKIISELLESVLREVEVPVVAHEILGDAISFYSIEDDTPRQADRIFMQLQRYFEAFRKREAELISSCKLCRCDACNQVGQLKLKAILHYGLAAFTYVQDTLKISGEHVIISHRLLKNNIPSKEYIAITRDFADNCLPATLPILKTHKESYEDVGTQHLLYASFENNLPEKSSISLLVTLRGFLVLEAYIIRRLFRPSRRVLSIPEHPNTISNKEYPTRNIKEKQPG